LKNKKLTFLFRKFRKKNEFFSKILISVFPEFFFCDEYK